MKHFTDLEITQTQQQNLITLFNFLRSHPKLQDRFSMRWFHQQPDSNYGSAYDSPVRQPECNTICCLAGFAPLAEINPLPEETWQMYVDRCFTSGNSDIFNFLFSSGHTSNLHAALCRIDYFLHHNLPDIDSDSLESWETDSSHDLSTHLSLP